MRRVNSRAALWPARGIHFERITAHARFQRRCRALLPGLLFVVGESALAAWAPATVSDCAECHSDHGVSTHKDVPTIAGMSDVYLEGQIQA